MKRTVKIWAELYEDSGLLGLIVNYRNSLKQDYGYKIIPVTVIYDDGRKAKRAKKA